MTFQLFFCLRTWNSHYPLLTVCHCIFSRSFSQPLVSQKLLLCTPTVHFLGSLVIHRKFPLHGILRRFKLLRMRSSAVLITPTVLCILNQTKEEHFEKHLMGVNSQKRQQRLQQRKQRQRCIVRTKVM